MNELIKLPLQKTSKHLDDTITKEESTSVHHQKFSFFSNSNFKFNFESILHFFKFLVKETSFVPAVFTVLYLNA